MPSNLEDFAKRYAEAWCGHKSEGVASFFAKNGSLSVNGVSPAVGRAAIAQVARGFMTTFPDMVVTMDGLVYKPQCVEFHWTLTGTNTGPNGTGKRVRLSGYEEWRMDED